MYFQSTWHSTISLAYRLAWKVDLLLLLLSHSFMFDSLRSLDCSMPDFAVFHYLPEGAQIHVHWVNDSIQQSHTLLPPSPLVLSIFQHLDLFQGVGSLHQVAKLLVSVSTWVLPMNIQGWFPLGLTDLIFLQSKGLSRIFSSTTVQKHQFFCSQPSLWSNSLIQTWQLEKPRLWLFGPLLAKWCLCFLICCPGWS